MQFFGDEFVVGNLIGQVSGQCRVNRDGEVELVSIDCQDAQFCRTDDPTGEPVELDAIKAEAIAGAIVVALASVTDAGFSDCIVMHSREPANAV
jgi:hypothetical protein